MEPPHSIPALCNLRGPPLLITVLLHEISLNIAFLSRELIPSLLWIGIDTHQNIFFGCLSLCAPEHYLLEPHILFNEASIGIVNIAARFLPLPRARGVFFFVFNGGTLCLCNRGTLLEWFSAWNVYVWLKNLRTYWRFRWINWFLSRNLIEGIAWCGRMQFCWFQVDEIILRNVHTTQLCLAILRLLCQVACQIHLLHGLLAGYVLNFLIAMGGLLVLLAQQWWVKILSSITILLVYHVKNTWAFIKGHVVRSRLFKSINRFLERVFIVIRFGLIMKLLLQLVFILQRIAMY